LKRAILAVPIWRNPEGEGAIRQRTVLMNTPLILGASNGAGIIP
jgi:hypothetical protein